MKKIICWLGMHDWAYRSKKTGVYLHSLYGGGLPREISYYDRKKCWDCGKIKGLSNQ